MARSYTRQTHFKDTHPFRVPPYQRVGAEAELAEDYVRMIGADPRPELGQYEDIPIPGVRRKAVPPANAMEEQFKLGRTASVRMKQRRQAKKSSHRKLNPFLVTTGGQAVPLEADRRTKEEEVEEFIEFGTPMIPAGRGHTAARHAQRLEERGVRFRIEQGSDGKFHIVDAVTGARTGKYALSLDSAKNVLAKHLARTNPAGEVATVDRQRSVYRNMRTGQIRLLTEKQAATPPYRNYEKIASNPELSRSTEKALERAAIASINELTRRIKRMGKVRKNPSPVPGISVEEVLADVQGEEWANWDFNRAGIMHWR